jgi:hypothetical protein
MKRPFQIILKFYLKSMNIDTNMEKMVIKAGRRNSMIIIDEQEKKSKDCQLNLKKFLTREIFKFFLKNTNSVQDSIIQEYLKTVIINSGYERLTFLLSDELKEKIILIYFLHLIRFVRYLFIYPEEIEHPSTIWRILKLPFKQNHSFLIIEDLKNHFSNYLRPQK